MSGLDTEMATNTVGVGSSGGRRNVWWSGEMLRDHTEHRLRRQFTKILLTLRHESVGRKQDKIAP